MSYIGSDARPMIDKKGRHWRVWRSSNGYRLIDRFELRDGAGWIVQEQSSVPPEIFGLLRKFSSASAGYNQFA